MAKQQMHLKDLFKTGEMVALEFVDPGDPAEIVSVELWLRKPTAAQQQEAMAKAQAKKARKRRALKDEESDDRVALVEELDEMETREEIIEYLVKYQEPTLRSKAMNDVLYDKDVGSDWGDDGAKYLEVVDAVSQRYQEILAFNDDLAEADKDKRIVADEDEDVLRLSAEQERFETEVEDRLSTYLDEERAKYKGKKLSELRNLLLKERIDVQSGLEWYQEYRTQLLFYALRYPENKKRLYFDSVSDILELPDYVQAKLFAAFDNVERGVDELKNSLSLPHS